MYRLADNIIIYSFYIIIAFVPFVFSPFNSELFELPKMYLVYALTVVILGAWAAKSILLGRIVFRKTFLDLPLLVFLASQVVSTFFSIDIYTSIFGYYSRLNGGLLSIFAYSFLYWAFVSNINSKEVRKIIILLIFCATVISIYAILEHFGASFSCVLLKGKFNTSCWVQNVQERVFATLGQPNWLAGWLVAIAPLTWMQLLNSKILDKSLKSQTILQLAATIILFAAILFTKSRSGMLGLGVAFVVFCCLLLLKVKPNLPLCNRGSLPAGKTGLMAVFVALITAVGFLFGGRSFSDCFDLNPAKLSEGAGTESCKIRAIVWKGAINIWRANPIFGTGPETFAYSYYQFRPAEHNLTSEWELLYNKAHNEYLNYLANTGAIGLTSYLFLIITFVAWSFVSIRSSLFNPLLGISILSGYTSLLVTNFFGFSTVTTNLLFFLYPGLAIAMHNKEHTPDSINFRLSWQKIAFLSLILYSTFYILSRIAGLWHSDTLYAQVLNFNRGWQAEKGVKLLKQAIAKNPWEPRYYDELSELYSILGEAELSKAYSDRAIAISPLNLIFWKTRAVNFKRLAATNPQYLDMAIDALEQATKLAPTEPKVHYNLSVLYDHKGEKEKAAEMIKKALNLKPNYEDAKEALQKLKE